MEEGKSANGYCLYQKKISEKQDGSQEQEDHFIGNYEAAPEYMQDNHNITSGYRINFKTKKSLLKSLFMLHNESVNIWSHLLPLLFFLGLLISLCLVAEDPHFKKEAAIRQQQLEEAYRDYQMSIRNLTIPERELNDAVGEKGRMVEFRQKFIQKYNKVIFQVEQHSNYLSERLNSNIQGIKSTMKEEIKGKINEMRQYMIFYESVVAPIIVSTVEHQLNFTFVEDMKRHAKWLKDHLDSNVFSKLDLVPDSPNPQHISRWPLFVFMTTAVLCLLFSTIFHLFYPLSSKAYGLLLRFDFAGISLLIAGSAFPTFYYSFYCHFAVAEIYLTSSVIAACLTFFISLFEWIHKKHNIKYRAVVFGSFGISMTIPLTHLVINQFIFDNFGDPYRFSDSYFFYFGLISSYLVGLYIFSIKCPERSNPGRYDICGHSHQIWHFLVVLGIIFTYYGTFHVYQTRKQAICPA